MEVTVTVVTRIRLSC